MTKSMQAIHDVETGEITTIELTDLELEILENEKTKALAEQQALQASKNALYERLGITEDEARLLLG